MRKFKTILLMVILSFNFSVHAQRLDIGFGVNQTYYPQRSEFDDGFEKLTADPGYLLDLRFVHWRKNKSRGTAFLQFQHFIVHYDYKAQRHQYKWETNARVIRYQLLAGFQPLEYSSKSGIIELHAGYAFMFLLKENVSGNSLETRFAHFPDPGSQTSSAAHFDNAKISIGLLGSVNVRAWQSTRSAIRLRSNIYSSVVNEIGSKIPVRATLDLVFSYKFKPRPAE